jgi:hypothetical protein
MNAYFYIIKFVSMTTTKFLMKVPKGSRNYAKIMLFNHLMTLLGSSNQVKMIIDRMKRNNLLEFLFFLHDSCFISYEEAIDEHKICLQMILIESDYDTLQHFFSSFEFHAHIAIIQFNIQLWLKHFISLFQGRHYTVISPQISMLGQEFGDEFGLRILELLGRQVDNLDLEYDTRQEILIWFLGNGVILSYIVQRFYGHERPQNSLLQNVQEWVAQTIERNRFVIGVEIEIANRNPNEHVNEHV